MSTRTASLNRRGSVRSTVALALGAVPEGVPMSAEVAPVARLTSMAPAVQMQFMRPTQLERAIRGLPVVYVPFGLIEWHGRHLPLGNDALRAQAILVKAAEQAGLTGGGSGLSSRWWRWQRRWAGSAARRPRGCVASGSRRNSGRRCRSSPTACRRGARFLENLARELARRLRLAADRIASPARVAGDLSSARPGPWAGPRAGATGTPSSAGP